MTILCSGDCHVWLGASSLCTCEAHRVAMYGLMVPYNPYGPHTPQPTPASPDVPLVQFKAAQDVGASWLSADGKRSYRDDRGSPEVSFWDDETKTFPSWWSCPEGLPADAVRIE